VGQSEQADAMDSLLSNSYYMTNFQLIFRTRAP